jgi:hypothetical protein
MTAPGHPPGLPPSLAPSRPCALNLAEVVRALGGDLYAGGQTALVPAPGHSPADRSASLRLVGRRVLIHCFAGDDWRTMGEDLRRRGLVDAEGCLIAAGGAGGPPAALTSGRRQAIAARLWGEGAAIAGSLAERHLRQRGVGGVLPPALRSHPAVAAAIYDDRGPRRPALLAAITDPGGALAGVEVTYLAASGAQARLPVPRKTVGRRPAGAAVRLTPPGPPGPQLLVGEGVVTCLSAAAVFGLPAWALMSAGNLPLWRPPVEVRAVLIAADRGAAGARAARARAARLCSEGIACAVRWPPWPHGDWNEAVCAAGVQGGLRSSDCSRPPVPAAPASAPPARRR